MQGIICITAGVGKKDRKMQGMENARNGRCKEIRLAITPIYK